MSVLGLIAVLMAGCESVSAVLVNDTGAEVDIAILDRNGQNLTGSLSAGQRFVLRRPLTEVVRIDYGYGAVLCSLSPENITSVSPSRRNETIVSALPPCDSPDKPR